jgi:hypothetical protein
MDIRHMHSTTRNSLPENKLIRAVISADLESAEALVEHYLVEVGARFMFIFTALYCNTMLYYILPCASET